MPKTVQSWYIYANTEPYMGGKPECRTYIKVQFGMFCGTLVRWNRHTQSYLLGSGNRHMGFQSKIPVQVSGYFQGLPWQVESNSQKWSPIFHHAWVGIRVCVVDSLKFVREVSENFPCEIVCPWHCSYSKVISKTPPRSGVRLAWEFPLALGFCPLSHLVFSCLA